MTDIEAYAQRQKEFREMLAKGLNSDVEVNETRPISSPSDDWGVVVRANGKSVNCLLSFESRRVHSPRLAADKGPGLALGFIPGDLMTDQDGNYQAIFNARMAELTKMLQE